MNTFEEYMVKNRLTFAGMARERYARKKLGRWWECPNCGTSSPYSMTTEEWECPNCGTSSPYSMTTRFPAEAGGVK